MTSSADIAADPTLIRDDDSMSEKTERDDSSVLSIEENS